MSPSDFWAGKVVAVTGGTGFLGRHLVRLLRERGAAVRVLDVRPGPWADVEAHVGDVRDRDKVRTALAGCEVVFHTAGTVAVWGKALAEMHAVHCDGTRNVLAAADAARVVHTSSVVAVGASKTPTPVTEETPFNLADVGLAYVNAKRAAEEIALAADQDVVVVNPSYLVGPDDPDGSIMGRFCRRFWAGRIILASPGGVNLVDVRDVAAGHLLAAEYGRAGRRYLLGGEDHSFASLLARMAEVAGMRPRWLPRMPVAALTAFACLAEVRGWLTGREPYPSLAHVRYNRWYFYCDSSRARAELGYAPRPLRESLADTYTWHRAEGLTGPKGALRWWLRAA
jgi:dihydroflavonol-4-reductase